MARKFKLHKIKNEKNIDPKSKNKFIPLPGGGGFDNNQTPFVLVVSYFDIYRKKKTLFLMLIILNLPKVV